VLKEIPETPDNGEITPHGMGRLGDINDVHDHDGDRADA